MCHDGVFDAVYNGYSTDELFFVSDRIIYLIYGRFQSPSNIVQPRMGRPTLGQGCKRTARTVQPDKLRAKVVDAAARDSQ